jgi:hypothetical protein
MTKYRTHLLLNPEQHKALSQIARREGRSISDLAREIVQEAIEQRQKSYASEQKKRLTALDRARRIRLEILKERGGTALKLDFGATLAELREERDDQILGRGH